MDYHSKPFIVILIVEVEAATITQTINGLLSVYCYVSTGLLSVLVVYCRFLVYCRFRPPKKDNKFIVCGLLCLLLIKTVYCRFIDKK